MSQENVEIVRRVYREVSSHGRAPAEVFDPEYALDLTDAKPDLGVLQGFEAAEGALREYWETFEKFRVDLQEIIHADEQRVVTAVRDGGRLKGSDAEVWNRFFHVWTFRNGKIVRRSSHADRPQALEAAGLRE
jgi:ketosteroid isomerase-like protein